ncbi:sodium pump decarboxylase subunit gamma [Hahella sp. CCB-MM4]|uniref:OadG family protein n=1 Tax=Hahella sp. (strain CCB-MM4) TaxID=1926491 RepID=UPI000B9C384F|nr:OadG family transporter subunit [Hahella sp. CCB-MM4]OZG72896.1 sodium pump decarboxylase subunit gamma [Hahella sp. CCB-MM4]
MNNLFQDAITLMFVGMGFVFLFLAILVVATSLMSKLVNKYFPEAQPAPASVPAPAPAQSGSEIDQDVMAVIAAAVAKYRSRHKK